ncbi:MAG: iron-containing alcohol dehydrogenase, partial [Sedimentibacter sp.]
MINFEWVCPTRIIFGKNTEERVGEFAKQYSNKILFHYGQGSIKKTGLYDKVVKSLKNANVEFIELGGVQPNPRLSLVRKGIEICKKEHINFILAVGGGSVIDSAKAIAAGVKYDGDIWELYEGKGTLKEALPVGVILTIPAAGSEASMGSVITNEDGWYKRSINYDILRPVFAIMNPELTYTLPPFQTAVGAVDMLTHVMERYFTNIRNVDLTDRLSEATMRTIIKNAPLALKNPYNYDVRAEIMWAGTVAHNGLLGTGREEDWATHDIEHEVSGIYDVAHGAGLAVLFPAWMKYVYRHDVNRFAQYATRVWNVEPDFFNLEKTALEGINRLERFYKEELNLPITLSGLKVPDDRFEEMAEKATEKGPIGNFV